MKGEQKKKTTKKKTEKFEHKLRMLKCAQSVWKTLEI